MSNTKNMLIEVARVLFAKNGKKDVTMNDIAEASKKGRRTLYTYFKNKEEIYKAVIDKELERVLERLYVINAEPNEPDVKLTQSHYHTFGCYQVSSNPKRIAAR